MKEQQLSILNNLLEGYQMKRLLLLLILSFLLFSGISVLYAQEDLTFTVPVMNSGDVIETEFNNDVTTRLYGFLATEGDVITITMTQDGSSELDPFIVLLGSSGQVLAVDDDSGEVELSSRIDYVIPVSDTYFLLASSYVFVDGLLMEEGADYGVMPFTLTLDGNNPPAESKGLENPLTIYYGVIERDVPFAGESTPELPVYFFLFRATAGEKVTMTMDSTDFPPILHLFDPNGARLALDIDPEAGTQAEIQVTTPEDGVYIVAATDMFFYEAVNYTTVAQEELSFTGGAFTLTISAGVSKK